MKYVLSACIVSTVVIKFSPPKQQQNGGNQRIFYFSFITYVGLFVS